MTTAVTATALVVFGLFNSWTGAAPQGHYASRYDHLDVNTILNNKRMVTYYAACLLSQGPCTPQGLELRHILPEALQTNCARCTEKQKTVAYRAIRRLRKEYPKIWGQLAAQWDPDGTFITKFEASFENKSSPVPVPAVLSTNFDDDQESDSNSVIQNSPELSTLASTPSFTTLSSTTTTAKSSTTPTPISFSTSASTNQIITKRPGVGIVTPTTTRRPLLRGVGANLRATVSLGTNIVGGIVKGLGDIGTRVVRTGARLADAVISTVVRP